MKEIFNYFRTAPVYWMMCSSAHRQLLEEDIQVWQNQTRKHFKSKFVALNFFLTYYKEFRNIVLHRLYNPSRTIKCKVHAVIARRLWKPLDSLYLNTREIGGGLFIQHGFATIVAAKK